MPARSAVVTEAGIERDCSEGVFSFIGYAHCRARAAYSAAPAAYSAAQAAYGTGGTYEVANR